MDSATTENGTSPKPDPISLTRDEFNVLKDLAYMVRQSQQNLPLRMTDMAASAVKILNSKNT